MEYDEMLLILVFSIFIYVVIMCIITYKPVESIAIGGSICSLLHIQPREDNIEEITGAKYDEYDDVDLLDEINPKFINTFNNIVIDGTNFLFKLRDYEKHTNKMDTNEYVTYIEKTVKLVSEKFPDKNLYFVFKDSETKKQENNLLDLTGTSTSRKAHKQIFSDLYKSYPNCRFIVAYGDDKYRDDYAAIWLADILPNETILLSRDRYRDVNEMNCKKIKFVSYGKDSAKINKLINKPFNFVTRGSVKSTLVGFSFNKSKKTGFYNKRTNKKSEASDTVYIFGC